MPMTYSVAHQNARLDQFTSDLGAAGEYRLYSGTPPATVRDALGANVLLATITLANPAAPGAAAGVLTLTMPQTDTNPGNSGTVTFFRMGPSGTDVAQGSVGLTSSGADLELDNVNIQTGFPVTINSAVITEGN